MNGKSMHMRALKTADTIRSGNADRGGGRGTDRDGQGLSAERERRGLKASHALYGRKCIRELIRRSIRGKIAQEGAFPGCGL